LAAVVRERVAREAAVRVRVARAAAVTADAKGGAMEAAGQAGTRAAPAEERVAGVVGLAATTAAETGEEQAVASLAAERADELVVASLAAERAGELVGATAADSTFAADPRTACTRAGRGRHTPGGSRSSPR